MSKHVFSIHSEQTLLDDQPILLKGLRLSNALISDDATRDVVDHLPCYRSYGVNSFSVYLMGNRFGDVRGYREDATLDPAHAARLERLLGAADEQAMVVLVGCLYWGHSAAKWASWSQTDAERAVANTAAWLAEREFQHGFLDTDNEGMAYAEAGFDNVALIEAAKAAAPDLPVAINNRKQQAVNADLNIHHSAATPGKPYIEAEGSAPMGEQDKGGYWGPWSNPYPDQWYQYDHIGEYRQDMREAQITRTFEHFDRGQGYFFASTWLQAAPPLGPNAAPGGDGTKNAPGFGWWLEALRERYGAYEGA